jgi:hypothetical protein
VSKLAECGSDIKLHQDDKAKENGIQNEIRL